MKELIVGTAEELTFFPHLNRYQELVAQVKVYHGETEYVGVTRAQAISLIDHLSTVFNLEEDSENPCDVNEDTAA